MFLNIYVNKINSLISNSKVRYLNGRGLEAVATVFLNKLHNKKEITIKDDKTVTILLHGFWGPQKNLKLALETLKRLKMDEFKFRIIISGGINVHFKNYVDDFYNLLNEYGVARNYTGFIKEDNIFQLFTNADLLILPYNTSGGHSAVLEQAIFFETPTIALDFPEYREQAEGVNYIKLCSADKLYSVIKHSFEHTHGEKIIKIEPKLEDIKNNMRILLNYINTA